MNPPRAWNVLILGQGELAEAEPSDFSGPLTRHLGHRFTLDEVIAAVASSTDEAPPPERASRVRAWTIPALEKQSLTCPRVRDVFSVLSEIVQDKLGVEFPDSDQSGEAMARYGILDVNAPVPPLAEEPMALAIFGKVQVLDGETVEGSWYEWRQQHFGRDVPSYSDLADLAVTIQIEQATVANVAHFGGPLFL